MTQMVMDGGTPFLPKEIITEILKRLPVKSLMRFTSVSKDWKNLFKTTTFVADHLRHSSNQNPTLMVIEDYGFRNPLYLRLLDCEMQLRDVQKTPQFDSLMSWVIDNVSSCNGLLCLAFYCPSTFSPTLLLWNPATRDVIEVTTSKTNVARLYKPVVGFGFSPFVNDYKIVRIYSDYANICKVEVYSLRRNSWKEIKFEILEDKTLFGGNVSSNGCIFWYGLKPGVKQGEWDMVLVSFDISMEVFTLIPWPALSTYSSFNLTVYEDKVAIISVHGIKGSFYIDLWVLEENIDSSGEGWSWMKKFTSSPCTWELSFGSIWRNEIVMAWSKSECEIEKNEPRRGLCRFNATTNEFKMIDVPQYLPGWDSLKYYESHFLSYAESLVSLVNIHNIEEV